MSLCVLTLAKYHRAFLHLLNITVRFGTCFLANKSLILLKNSKISFLHVFLDFTHATGKNLVFLKFEKKLKNHFLLDFGHATGNNSFIYRMCPQSAELNSTNSYNRHVCMCGETFSDNMNASIYN